MERFVFCFSSLKGKRLQTAQVLSSPGEGYSMDPKTQLEEWGARKGELFTKSTLDGKALGLQQSSSASCPASEKAGEARVMPASSASSP